MILTNFTFHTFLGEGEGREVEEGDEEEDEEDFEIPPEDLSNLPPAPGMEGGDNLEEARGEQGRGGEGGRRAGEERSGSNSDSSSLYGECQKNTTPKGKAV